MASLIDGATLPGLQKAECELADAERAIHEAREDFSAQLHSSLRVVA